MTECDDIAGQLDCLVSLGPCACRTSWTDLYQWAVSEFFRRNDFSSEFSETVFDEIDSVLAKSLLSSSCVTKYQAFVEGLDIERRELLLDPDIRLQSVPAREVERLWNEQAWMRDSYALSGGRSRAYPFDLRVLAATTVSEKKKVADDSNPNPAVASQDEIVDRFRKLMSVLRLLKSGRIRLGPILVSIDGPFRQCNHLLTVEDDQ